MTDATRKEAGVSWPWVMGPYHVTIRPSD